MNPKIFALAITLATTCPTGLRAQAGQFDLDRTKSVLTGMIERALRDRGVPSISIALVRGDSIVWRAAFGYANLRTRTPATPETIYSTGSSFKSATATALLQLEEAGKVALDRPVNRYLGDLRVQDRLQSDKPVTVSHILSHWSGLVGGETTKPVWGRELPRNLEGLASRLYSIRAPEAKWEYNNAAYGLAGLLVEKVSGQEYERYIVDRVLKPLGVTTAHPVYPSPEMVELMALPYVPSANGPRAVDQVHFDVYPAGDVFLTATDMARFLGAHLNGGVFNGQRILSETSVTKAHTPLHGGTYGLGWWARKAKNGNTIIVHGGAIPGQTANMMGDLDAKVGVYFMTNYGSATPEIADAAIALLRGENYVPFAERSGIAVDSKTLDSYAGRYTGDMTLTVERSGADLVGTLGGPQGKATLVAESPTSFFARTGAFTVTFARNPAGTVDRAVIEIGTGPSFTLTRQRPDPAKP